MTAISWEAFKALEAANPCGINLGGLGVLVPAGTPANVGGHVTNGMFMGCDPAGDPIGRFTDRMLDL